jgi:GNAT superfamily N-acetyltransferase
MVVMGVDVGSDDLVTGGVVLRRARAREVEALSTLAVGSKAHWGYDEDFIDACRHELTVLPGDLGPHRMTVAVEPTTDRVVGFYGLVGTTSDDAELSWLFVEPGVMGRGVGRLLFEDAVRTARHAGFGCFRIESDPFAATFYEHVGAVRTGAVPSRSIAERELPLYVMGVPPAP